MATKGLLELMRSVVVGRVRASIINGFAFAILSACRVPRECGGVAMGGASRNSRKGRSRSSHPDFVAAIGKADPA